jgi:hypothetical protein
MTRRLGVVPGPGYVDPVERFTEFKAANPTAEAWILPPVWAGSVEVAGRRVELYRTSLDSVTDALEAAVAQAARFEKLKALHPSADCASYEESVTVSVEAEGRLLVRSGRDLLAALDLMDEALGEALAGRWPS